ncbi:MAG TPA: CehA/McbA family metallohydrolase [Panacibacter sp.]|nr:CehA/McbA family metallohydrolase [Panacibacter sp.]HNP42639.1 CehA/McbA family metallohydrolase [Panacibacter sp.]
MKINSVLLAILLLYFFPSGLIAQNNAPVKLVIDGAKKLNQLDGIGVNANTRSWDGEELKPALDLLLDSMHAGIWRVIVETVEKWEDVNDNDDPFNFNWDYYNKLYETPKFQKAFDMIAYLNAHGITNNLMLNFMGPVPGWIGKKTISPGKEDEYVEMLVSFLYYAKNTKHLQFGLVSPTNESDWHNEGPELNEQQYASVLRKLIRRMGALGMANVRYVGPDPAGMENGIKRYIPELVKDTVIMSKMAHFGLHSYGGYYANADSAIKKSPYPKTGFWITEWNAWRDGLDDGKIGVYDYRFASDCVGYLLDLLKNGAGAAIEWEAYDSYYEHHAPSLFSYWGILGYDPATKTYLPRKHFYAIQQVSKFVSPGSFQLAVSGEKDSLTVLAFQDGMTKDVSIVGINTSGKAVEMDAAFKNLPAISRFEMYYTNSTENLHKNTDVKVNASAFSVTIPANCIFTLRSAPEENKPGTMIRPEPGDWYAGDIHVHRNCGDATDVLPYEKLTAMMQPNNLAVISVLADMGNGEVKDSKADLPRVSGKNDTQSNDGRIIHWDCEWHWDATYSNFSNQALGGHLVLLGLKQANQIWDESPYKILEWAKGQQAIKGFAHMEYLDDKIQDELNCCIPVDYPVEAALGTIDFVSEDVYAVNSPNNGNYNSEAAINAYYKLLNCGFRIGLAAGTDFPCNDLEPLGKLLTYVKVNEQLTYDKWIRGIKDGKTVVSRDGHNEFIDMKINGKYGPGDEIKFKDKGILNIEVKWTTTKETTGRIELVENGKVIAVKEGTSKPGAPLVLSVQRPVDKSSWICARRMTGAEHASHAAAVYVTVNNKPVRASAEDARFFVSWIDNVLKNITTSGKWSRYFTHDLDVVKARYTKARDIYSNIAAEASKQ